MKFRFVDINIFWKILLLSENDMVDYDYVFYLLKDIKKIKIELDLGFWVFMYEDSESIIIY